MHHRHPCPPGTAAAACPLAAAALALLLLLPAAEARAQTSSWGSCGLAQPGAHHHGTHECDATEAAGGIAYWTGGSGGTTTALTITVPGAAATVSITTIDPAFEAATRIRESGIVLVGSSTASRSLTVGATGPVAIVQRSGVTYTGAIPHDSGNGIVVYPNAVGLTGSLTIDLRAGVTIGTAATPMLNDGVWLNSNSATNAAAHRIDSGARIWATNDGIRAVTLGTGKVTIANTGAIDANRGLVLATGAANTGGAEIVNSGTVTARTAARIVAVAVNGSGIYLDQKGTGPSTVFNSGAIAAGGNGIALHHRGASGAISLTNRGPIVAGSRGIWIHHLGTGAGALAFTNSGAIETTSRRDDGTEYPGAGILIRKASTGDVTFVNTGGVESARQSIVLALDGASGDVSVTNSGSLTARGVAMWILNRNRGTQGAVTVTNRGDVSGSSHGIHAETEKTAGAVTVTHAAGVIAVTGRGIHAQNTAGNPDDVTVRVTGGSVTATGTNRAVSRKPAVEVNQLGTGSAVFQLAAGASLTSRHDAGVIAALGNDADNAAGQVRIVQAGTIAARTGVDARVTRASAAGETRAADGQPLIDVAWTGTFSHGTTATVAPNDDGRFVVLGDDPVNVRWLFADPGLREQVGYPYTAVDSSWLEAQVRGATRYGAPAGIDALVMSWREVAEEVSKGDDPGAFADAAAQTALFSASADAATRARAAAVVSVFRAALTHPEFEFSRGLPAIDTDGTAGLSDAEIVAWLSRDSDLHRALLRGVLAQSLSEKETAVLRAVVANTGLDAALDDPQAGFSTGYKAAVRALLDRFNLGGVRVAMNAGSIASRGDGIRAWYATPHAMNGSIAVTVAEGASVTGAMAGIYVANAGTGLRIQKRYTSPAIQEENRDLAPGDLVSLPDYLDQVVRVQGTVTGGSDAAVHLAGGGALIVTGAGRLVAGSSGRAVLVNDPGPAVIYIEGQVTGGEGPEGDPAPAAVHLTGGGSVTVALTGRLRAGGAMSAIRSDGAPAAVIVQTGETLADLTREGAADALGRVEGGIVGDVAGGVVTLAEVRNGRTTGHTRDLPLEDGEARIDDLPPRTFSCDLAMDGRCRLYEALPSVLLAMNGLPSYGERLAAARSETGGWARLEASRGEWAAEDSTRAGLAYDHDRSGVRAGVDLAVDEDTLLGVSMHGLRGEAEMTRNGGKVELAGMGVGVSATTVVGGLYLDAQVQAAWFDVDLTSGGGEKLKDGVGGEGYALALEAGRSTALNERLSLTPLIGLGWSRVSLDGFTDLVGSGARVSVEDADSLTARLGLSAALSTGGLRLSASMEAMQEFSAETGARVSGTQLEASSETTAARLGIGVLHSWNEGRHTLQGSASYTASGGNNSTLSGSLSLSITF